MQNVRPQPMLCHSSTLLDLRDAHQPMEKAFSTAFVAQRPVCRAGTHPVHSISRAVLKSAGRAGCRPVHWRRATAGSTAAAQLNSRGLAPWHPQVTSKLLYRRSHAPVPALGLVVQMFCSPAGRKYKHKRVLGQVPWHRIPCEDAPDREAPMSSSRFAWFGSRPRSGTPASRYTQTVPPHEL
jgi:hypothetical protein